MALLYVVGLIPVLVAAGIAVAFWLFQSRRAAVPDGTARTFTAAGSGFALLVILGYSLLTFWPFWMSSISIDTVMAVLDLRFTLPLVLGIFTLILIAVPVRGSGAYGSAELSRRTLLSFARSWWFIAFGVVFLLAVGLALAAGTASAPDDHGRYTMYFVHVGSMTAGSTIYGWFYSVPCLILLTVTVTVTVVDLAVISRPALALDRDKDIAIRRVRTLNVARVGTGAVLIHLAAVLHSLAATSSINAQLPTATAGRISVGTSFAALTTSLQVTSLVVTVLGLALWFSTLLSVIPAPHRARRRASIT
jgi:hypothetical protein